MSKTEVNKTGILSINGVKIGLDSGGNLAFFGLMHSVVVMTAQPQPERLLTKVAKQKLFLNMPKTEVTSLLPNVNFGTDHLNFIKQSHNYLTGI